MQGVHVATFGAGSLDLDCKLAWFGAHQEMRSAAQKSIVCGICLEHAYI